jgi:hypothetical protein
MRLFLCAYACYLLLMLLCVAGPAVRYAVLPPFSSWGDQRLQRYIVDTLWYPPVLLMAILPFAIGFVCVRHWENTHESRGFPVEPTRQ